MFKFNIGSAVAGVDNAISIDLVLDELNYSGFVGVQVIKTERSNTETTFIITADGFNDTLGVGHEAAVYASCITLQQDAIAYKVNDTGYLVGPKAADWGGEFNQDYFIE